MKEFQFIGEYLSELSKNPIWTPLGVVVAIIIALIQTTRWFLFRERKELSYERISDTSIVSIHKSFAGNVKVTFSGIPSKTLQLIRFKIINTGNKVIEKDDFDEPLTFVDFKPEKNGQATGYFAFDFPETSPKGLHPDLYTYHRRHGIKPLLLHPGDTITVEMLNVDMGDRKAVLDVQARIKEVKRIKELKSSDSIMPSIQDAVLGVLTGSVFSALTYILGSFLFNVEVNFLLGMISVILPILIFYALMFYGRNFFLGEKEERSL
jgi:hypothetical protein